MAGLRRGTPSAFAGLHEQYAAGIYNLALRMVRHTSDAEDITQDVLIRAYERLPRERGVFLRPWLYRLTLNRCYDHLRAARRRPSVSVADHDPVSPHDPFEQSELHRLFESALHDLTRRQRAALLLKDVHGLTLVEVAACLELTPGSVEVLLARARKAFRARFEGHCLAEGRPAPGSARGLAGLPGLAFHPLPPALLAPPPIAGHLPLPVIAPPVVATGGGIGALLGLPGAFKTAAVLLAAAATVGTAEVAVTHGDGPRHAPRVAAASAGSAAPSGRRPAAAAPCPSATGCAAAATPSPTPTDLGAPAPLPSPSSTWAAEPSPSPTPLGLPSSTPSPTADPQPTNPPTPHATVAPTPSPTPTAPPPGPSPSASPSPAP